MNIQNKSISELKLLGERIYTSPNLQLIYNIHTFKEIVYLCIEDFNQKWGYDLPKWVIDAYTYFLYMERSFSQKELSYENMFDWIHGIGSLCDFVCN